MCMLYSTNLICEKYKINSLCQNISGGTLRRNDVILKSMLRCVCLFHKFNM